MNFFVYYSLSLLSPFLYILYSCDCKENSYTVTPPYSHLIFWSRKCDCRGVRLYECSYNQRNYLVFWKSVLMTHVLITRFLYDVLISRVLISRIDCICSLPLHVRPLVLIVMVYHTNGIKLLLMNLFPFFPFSMTFFKVLLHFLGHKHSSH